MMNVIQKLIKTRNGPKTKPRANQNIRRSPNATTKVRNTDAIDTTQNGIDTILTGDSVTQYVRMAKTENIIFLIHQSRN